MNKILTFSTILMLIILTASFLVPSTLTNKSTEKKPFYVGVNYCGNSTSEAKLLIDRVKTYTNLFVLQSSTIWVNETATKEICDYAVAQGLNILVNLGTRNATLPWYNDTTFLWHLLLIQNAKQRWGNRFLGVYYDDEPGGVQLDYDWASFFASSNFTILSQSPLFRNSSLYKIYQETLKANVSSSTPKNYSDEAKWFTDLIRMNLLPDRWKATGITSFTSDWTLYWWDYLGGYDVILAQLGWNHTLTQDIALVRGAARMQNKSWGTIITWKYDEPPYIDSGENIYQQILMSYEAGATYVVIFNYPQIEGNPYGGILTDDHFEALERFWNDVMTEPHTQNIPDYSQAEAALVLPTNYGWGMRRPDDTIWGFWGPDERSPQIWNISRTLLEQYGLNLDIVYDDPAFPATGKYSQIYYWNQTS
jgi:hypothetical protein